MIEAVPFDLPFEEAIAWFARKGFAITPESWRQLWREANARAFTVARVTDMDVLVDIRTAVDRALEAGTTLADFKKELVPTLERKGWWTPEGERALVTFPDGAVRKRLAPWRLETIFNTNVQTAYAAGRYTQQMAVAEQRPIWQYNAVLDSVTRPEHRALNGLAYDYRHPFWSSWYPPNGFNCRCFVTTLSGEEAREEGVETETQWPVDPATGRDLRPDPGWDYNPGKDGLNSWKPDLSKYPPELAGQFKKETYYD